MTFANAPNTKSKSSLASSAPTSRAVSLNRSEVWDDACGLAWMLRSLGQKPMRHRRGRTARHELVYFCSEHIENAEASRARVCLLVHDINSELHPLAVDVHSFGRSAFRDPIKVVRECSLGVISARQLHMPRRFDGHRLCTFPGSAPPAGARRSGAKTVGWKNVPPQALGGHPNLPVLKWSEKPGQ
jgi:hypothetical protein